MVLVFYVHWLHKLGVGAGREPAVVIIIDPGLGHWLFDGGLGSNSSKLGWFLVWGPHSLHIIDIVQTKTTVLFFNLFDQIFISIFIALVVILNRRWALPVFRSACVLDRLIIAEIVVYILHYVVINVGMALTGALVFILLVVKHLFHRHPPLDF